MIRRPPRSTPLYSSAASDVYKRQVSSLLVSCRVKLCPVESSRVVRHRPCGGWFFPHGLLVKLSRPLGTSVDNALCLSSPPVSYTHLRAHETKANLVCRLLLEKK